MKKGEIRIISKSHNELSCYVIAGEEKYLVQTENSLPQIPIIITKILLNGKIVTTIKTDYRGMADALDTNRINELMQRQHQLAISMLKTEQVQAAKTPADYIEGVKILLMRKNQKNALELMRDASEHYPEDPFILSYYGCLEAIANKKYKFGIDTCDRAIKTLKEKVPFGEEFFYPVLYLNLGRAYLAAGKKKNALDAFNKGFEMDRENRDLLTELRRLGIRKKPAVSFLGRSNPINKYIGMLLHKLSK